MGYDGILPFKKIYKGPYDLIENVFYPPILSHRAECAGTSLTISDMESTYHAMKNMYEELAKNGETKYTLLKIVSLYTKANFMWFATFFKEIEKQYNKVHNTDSDVQIPFNLVPDRENNNVYSYLPIEVTEKDNKYYVKFKEYRKGTSESVTVRNRINYIKEFYEVTDFVEGFPSWYIITRGTTVFEKYFHPINKRVKINFRDNEFTYFISGASDNWKKLSGVPIEIDYIVAALLFRDD